MEFESIFKLSIFIQKKTHPSEGVFCNRLKMRGTNFKKTGMKYTDIS